MPLLELPHTPGCLVCGRQNPHGLHLSLRVDDSTGDVWVDFTPRAEHIGFEGVVHGGVVATVVDEAMVWAATWAGRRFCLLGEMSIRFRQSALVGKPLKVRAKVESARLKLIQAACEVLDEAGNVVATATGKYIPLSPDANRRFIDTLVDEPATLPAAQALRSAM